MRIKKALSIIMAVAMIITAVPFSVGSLAADKFQVDSEVFGTTKADSDSLIRPNTNINASPITRVCYSLANPLKSASGLNSVTTQATPSGIAKNSMRYASVLYAGETPTATTIVFSADDHVSSDNISISCSNESIRLSSVQKSGNNYTWTVLDGCAAAVGETLAFTVSYRYSYHDNGTGKTYNSDKIYKNVAYSYVESVVEPAGIYSYRRTWMNWGLGQDTKNRAYFSSFLLGIGVYTDSTTTGGTNFNGEGTTADYGKMLINESNGGTYTKWNVGYRANSDRPTATIYFDKGLYDNLSDQNVRLQTFVNNVSSDEDEITTISTDGIYEYSGNVDTFEDEGSNSSNIREGNADFLKLQKSSSSARNVGDSYLQYFASTGGNEGTSGTYTLMINYHTPAGYNDVYLTHSYTITVKTVNKSALRSAVQTVVNKDPDTVTTSPTNGGKGYNPQEWYYSAGWPAYEAAYLNAYRTFNKPDVTQAEINSVTTTLNQKYNALEIKPADYQELDFYYNKSINLNSALYTTESWDRLQSAISQYRSDYSIFYQPKVDQITIDLQNAYNALEYATADYTETDRAADEVNALIIDAEEHGLTVNELYTNWSVVDAALISCGYELDSEYGYYILTNALDANKQATVDTYPTTIRQAKNKLTKRTADYTTTQEVLRDYSTFKSNIEPYITTESYNAVESAYSALSALYTPPKTIDYQQDIEDAVAALRSAMENYEFRPANYKAANAAIARADALDRSLYSNLTAVDNAYNNLLSKFGLDARYQSTVDSAVATLVDALNALSENGADYTAVTNAKLAADAEADRIFNLYKDSYHFTVNEFYTNWDAVEAAEEAVVYGLPVSQQSQVNAYAAAINNALAALTEAPADYTALNAVEAEGAAYLEEPLVSKYTEASIDNLVSALFAVTGYNLKISKQATVDAYTEAIREAIDNLELLKADYTMVNQAIASANAAKQQSASFAAAHNGYPYYTAASIDRLNTAISNVVYDLPIDQQSTVTGYADAINNAKNALVIADADYTEVNRAEANVPNDLSPYTESSKAVLNLALNYTKGLKANKQSQVDGYAAAITSAINSLEYIGADYTSVTQAIANAPTDSKPYTPGSWANLQNAINAVNYNLKYNQQAQVEAYADAINVAVSRLQYAAADYTKVNQAITQARAVLASADAVNYTEQSKANVQSAIDAVNYDLKYDQQDQVDAFEQAINAAVAALEYAALDTSGYDAAVQRYNGINKSLYTDESINNVDLAFAAFDNITPRDIRSQARWDEAVAAVNAAMDDLVMKRANINDLDAAIKRAEALIATDLYISSSVEYLTSAVNSGKDLLNSNPDITQQTAVNSAITVINNAISSLVFKPIDKTSFENAKKTVPADLSIYTDASVAAMNSAKDAIDTFLSGSVNINNQAELEELVTVYVAKINALENNKKPADYSALNAVIEEFRGLNEDDYTNYYDAYNVYRTVTAWKAANPSKDITQQSEVDAQTALLRNAIDSLTAVASVSYFRAREGSTTVIDGNYIYGLKTKLTAANLRNTFLDYNNVEVTFKKAIEDARYYGTGSTVTVVYPNGNTEVYTIIVYGDIDGNSVIDSDDAFATLEAASDNSLFTSLQKKAANLDGVRRISVDDYAIINEAALGISEISQTLD